MNSPAAQSTLPATGSPSEPLRVLVVDDEQHMCEVCSRTLRRNGYAVVTTNDPHAAAQMLNSGERFDLLLTDIKMPTMSGLDLAYLAREHDPSISIIIMTGFASMEMLQQSVRNGIAEFLCKPFELEQLRLAVDQALHKRTLLQENLRLRALEQQLANSEAFSATLELDEVTRLLLGATLQKTVCRVGFVLLAEEGASTAPIATSQADAQVLDAGYALIRRALTERQTLLCDGEPFARCEGDEMRYALAAPMRAQGNVSGLLLLCDDLPIVLRPGMQEELLLLTNYAGAALRNAYLYNQLGNAYQRLQELDRLKSEFISIASHELRTPLSIVLGYAMMLRDKGSDEQRTYSQRVMDNAQRIKDIVDDMVNLRHLETGETRLVLERCVLQELLGQAVTRMQPAAEQRRHTLDLALPEQPLVFLCDREKVLLIMGHLLSNAIRFTPEQGAITVTAAYAGSGGVRDRAGRTVETPATDAPGWAVIEVQDTGIGIPEHEQERIFERFYQVADSLTRRQGGTGLGLAIVREMVHALRGCVWVTSREGQGSTFGFALPYRQVM